jgi:hypothetical protein
MKDDLGTKRLKYFNHVKEDIKSKMATENKMKGD